MYIYMTGFVKTEPVADEIFDRQSMFNCLQLDGLCHYVYKLFALLYLSRARVHVHVHVPSFVNTLQQYLN